MRMTEIINISRKITFSFFIKETYESGIVLFGWEVKSVKSNGINIVGSYINFRNSECWLNKSFISMNKSCSDSFELEHRDRKLLLKKKEIIYLLSIVKIKGYTVLPCSVFLKNNFIKLSICLCVGKKKHENKSDVKKRFLSFRDLDF